LAFGDAGSRILFEQLAHDEEHHIDFRENQPELVIQVGIVLFCRKRAGRL
jgi:bacterioferritin